MPDVVAGLLVAFGVATLGLVVVLGIAGIMTVYVKTEADIRFDAIQKLYDFHYGICV